MTQPKQRGEDALANAMLADLGDPPDEQYLVFDEDGKLLHMPEHIREARAKRAAQELADKLTNDALKV